MRESETLMFDIWTRIPFMPKYITLEQLTRELKETKLNVSFAIVDLARKGYRIDKNENGYYRY